MNKLAASTAPRRAHDHHRDLHPVEPAQSTAASAELNRGATFVTRHGLNHPGAEAIELTMIRWPPP